MIATVYLCLLLWFTIGVFVFGFVWERTTWDGLGVIIFSIFWPALVPITLIGKAGQWLAKRLP